MNYKSIVTDVRPAEQPEGTYRWALNKVKNRKRAALTDDMPISKEPQDNSRDITQWETEEEVFIGKIALPSEDTVVFSMAFSSVNAGVIKASRIFVLHHDGTRDTVIDDTLLNFQEDSFIDGVYVVNSDGTTSIIFTDNINSPKLINLDNPIAELDEQMGLKDKGDIALLDYFLKLAIPTISSLEVDDYGGGLKSGVYSYAIAYEFGESSSTNYLPVSNLVPITASKKYGGFSYYEGCDAGTVTGKSVSIEYTGLDKTFDRFKLGIIKKIDGIVSCEEISGGLIDEFGRGKITHTGNETAKPILLEDIIINNADYRTAKTLTFTDNKLYMGNLTTDEYSGQKEANDIKIEWVFDEDISLDGTGGSFKDESVCFASKSFMPGETMAFYIAWLKNSGGYTPACLISGRQASVVNVKDTLFQEDDTIEHIQTSLEAAGKDAGYLDADLLMSKEAKYFQTRDTSTTTKTISEVLYGSTQVVGGEGTMGFWENDELYPEQFPGFAGQKVRHHRFPSLSSLGYAGLLHTLVEGEEPQASIEEFSISAVLINTDYEFEEKQVQYDVTQNTGELTTLSMVQSEHYESVDLVVTFEKKCEVEYWFNAKATGIKIVRNPILGWLPIKSKARLHMSLEADGHGHLTEEVNNENSTNWYYYYTPIKVDGSTRSSGHMIMRKGDKMTLNISGDRGVKSLSDFSLRLKVKEWNVASNGLDGSVFTNSLGIKLSDIRVPTALEGKVTGYQIFYAKRTLNNSTVYAQGVPMDYQTLQTHKDTEGITEFRIHPADLMVNDNFPSIPLSYIRHEVSLLTDTLEEQQAYNPVPPEEIVMRVQDYSYDPYNPLTQSEAKFRYSLTEPTSNWTSAKLVSLMGYKTNVYSVYYDQQLICTGPVFAKNRKIVEKLMGGDMYINKYAFRATNDQVPGDVVFSHMVWSAAHIGYRQEGDEYGEMYSPVHTIPGEFGVEPEGHLGVKAVSNYVKVNSDYSSLNEYNQAYSDNVTRTKLTKFPHRVIASTIFHIEGDADMLRRVLPGDYYELTKDRGEINNLQGYSGELIIHTESALFKTVSRIELDSSEVALTVGSGNLFRMAPRELYFDTQGVAGTLRQSSCEILNGHYVFIDDRVGQVYSLREKLDSFTPGNTLMFQDKLKLNIVQQIKELTGEELSGNTPHSRIGIGYSLGWDERFKRYFITKKDFKLLTPEDLVLEAPCNYTDLEAIAQVVYAGNQYWFTVFLDAFPDAMDVTVVADADPLTIYNIVDKEDLGDGSYKLITGDQPYNPLIGGPATDVYVVLGLKIYKDPTKIYLHEGVLWDSTGRVLNRNHIAVEDMSFTVSFGQRGELISEHSHSPGFYISTNGNLRSALYSAIYKHNSYIAPISMEAYVDIVTPFQRLARMSSISIDSQTYNANDVLQPKGEFDSLMVYNDTQCSGEVDITGNKGRSGALVFNKFLDQVGEDVDFMEDNVVDVTKLNTVAPKRFYGTFAIVRLITRDIAKNFVLLYNAVVKEIPL